MFRTSGNNWKYPDPARLRRPRADNRSAPHQKANKPQWLPNLNQHRSILVRDHDSGPSPHSEPERIEYEIEDDDEDD
jgi:hypothetical protein